MVDSALKQLLQQADKTMELLKRVNPSLANKDALSPGKLTDKIKRFHDLWQELAASVPDDWKLNPLKKSGTDNPSVEILAPTSTCVRETMPME